MTLRAVLFDWDDTLSYTEPHYGEMLLPVLAAHGVAVNRAQLHRAWAAATRDMAPDWFARLPALLGVGDRPEVAAAMANAEEERVQIRQRRLFDDVTGSLRYLRGLGLRVGVLSDNWNTVLFAEQHGLAHLLDLIVTPRQAGAMKPDPQIFRLAVECLGFDPAECLYVGDAYDVDIKGARGAGLDCLLIDRWGLGEEVDCRCVPSLDGVLRYLAESRVASPESRGMRDED